MLKRKNIKQIAILIACLTLLLTIVIEFILYTDKNYFKYGVYYLNEEEKTLEPVMFKIKRGSKVEEIEKIYQLYTSQPDELGLTVAKPQNINITDFVLDNETLYLYLDEDVKDITNLQRLLFEGSAVWSFTGLDYVKEVAFVNGVSKDRAVNPNSIYFSDRNTIKINPLIAPEKIVTNEIELYFPNDKMRLQKETRSINYNSDKLLESYIVEQIIKGPINTNLVSYIPTGVKINGVMTENGICYVDLSGDFIDESLEMHKKTLSIYSIVNSLTQLQEVDAVQFLIDSQKYGIYGEVDLSVPLEFNNKL